MSVHGATPHAAPAWLAAVLLCGALWAPKADGALRFSLTPPGNALFSGQEHACTVTVSGFGPDIHAGVLTWSLRTVPANRPLSVGENRIEIKNGQTSASLRLRVPETRRGVAVPLQLQVGVLTGTTPLGDHAWGLLAVHERPPPLHTPNGAPLRFHGPDPASAEKLRDLGLEVEDSPDLATLQHVPPGVLIVQLAQDHDHQRRIDMLWRLCAGGWRILLLDPSAGPVVLPPDHNAAFAAVRLLDSDIVSEISPGLDSTFPEGYPTLRLVTERNRIAVRAGVSESPCVWAEFLHALTRGRLVIFTLPRMGSEAWEKDARARYLLVDSLRCMISKDNSKGEET